MARHPPPVCTALSLPLLKTKQPSKALTHLLPAGHGRHGALHLYAQRSGRSCKAHGFPVRLALQDCNRKGCREAVACVAAEERRVGRAVEHSACVVSRPACCQQPKWPMLQSTKSARSYASQTMSCHPAHLRRLCPPPSQPCEQAPATPRPAHLWEGGQDTGSHASVRLLHAAAVTPHPAPMKSQIRTPCMLISCITPRCAISCRLRNSHQLTTYEPYWQHG